MAILAEWDMTGAAASTEAEGLTAADLANERSLPIWAQNAARGFVSDPVAFAAALSGAINEATALSLGSWFPATITPDTGATVSLSAVSFVIAKDGSSGTRGYVLRSSADNYASNLAGAVLATVKPTWTTVSVDLSGIAALQDCADPITFRIYLYTSGALQQLDFDTITIEGTVVLPPSTHAISGTVTLDEDASPLPGVTITANGSSDETDVLGDYSIPDLADGEYTVTPTLEGYEFDPTAQVVTLAGADQVGIDFVGGLIGSGNAFVPPIGVRGGAQFVGPQIAGGAHLIGPRVRGGAHRRDPYVR